MRMLRFSFPAVLLLAITTASPAAAQVLYGTVTDAADGTPVTVAQVRAVDSAGATAAWTLSGRDGRFELRLPAPGAFRLHVSRVGFRDGVSPDVAVGEGELIGVELRLRGAAVRLEAIDVRSRVTPPFRDRRARGFYQRMERGRGLYYTAEQIAAMGHVHPTEVITHYAGISIQDGRLWMGGDRRGCSPRVYIDGFYRPGEFLDNELEPGDIWGIEIYRYAWEIPSELPRDDLAGGCGIVMIWTRFS